MNNIIFYKKKFNFFNGVLFLSYIINFFINIMSIKLVIFDMDKTLRDETLFSQVPNILTYLKEKNIHMAIASLNPYAEWFCERYNIKQYFDCIHGYWDKRGKKQHLCGIFNKYKYISYSEVLFIDDNEDIIKSLEKHFNEVNFIKVNPEKGIQIEQIRFYIP